MTTSLSAGRRVCRDRMDRDLRPASWRARRSASEEAPRARPSRSRRSMERTDQREPQAGQGRITQASPASRAPPIRPASTSPSLLEAQGSARLTRSAGDTSSPTVPSPQIESIASAPRSIRPPTRRSRSRRSTRCRGTPDRRAPPAPSRARQSLCAGRDFSPDAARRRELPRGADCSARVEQAQVAPRSHSTSYATR
jgi:hypothetical protein